jgi:hypothetical protein
LKHAARHSPGHCGVVIARRCLIALTLAGWVQAVSAASIDDLMVRKVGARYFIELHAHLNARASVAYAVFADLNNLPSINTDVKRIEIAGGRGGEPAQLYTEIRACLLFYCRTIRESQQMTFMPERDGGEVVATVLPKGDLRYGRASWVFHPSGDQTEFDATAELEPAFAVPPLIGPWLIKRWLREETERSSENLEKLTRAAAASQPSKTQVDDRTN